MEGKQLSTSRSIAIYISDVLERYDPDPVRYFLTAAGPETQDSDFSWAEFLRRNNDELLANWGNLVNRTLTNAQRNFGEVPQPGELTNEDREALAEVEAGFATVGRSIEEAKFKQALAEAMRLSSIGNQYVDHQAPWAVIKEDRERAATILFVALRIVDSLKVIFTPFLPFSSQKLHELLGYEGFIAGPLEFREIEEEEEAATRSSRATTRAGSAAGSRASSRRAETAGARAALPKARAQHRRRRARSPDRDVIDTHAHLDALEDAEAAVARAREAGVTRIISIGTDPVSWANTLDLIEAHEDVYGVVGLHPHEATLTSISRSAAAPRPPEDRRARRDRPRLLPRLRAARRAGELFIYQLGLAKEAKLPVVIHNRAADEDTVSILRQWFDGTVVLHCFSSVALLDEAVEHGWYVSFAGNVTYKNADDLRVAARAVPAERLLAETDCPVPRTAAGPREDERAGVRRPYRHGSRRSPRRRPGSARRADRCERDRGVRPAMSVRAKKKLGQHFLVDENILGVIGRLAELDGDDVVLEVGPGLGVLTTYLADRVAQVYAVELDASLEKELTDRLAGRSNVELRFGDALKLDLAEIAPGARKLVANLPYNIATPLVAESLDRLPEIELWTVMVQREVADRFFAAPSTKAYGAVSVLVQLVAERTGFHPVSPAVFRPRPNVDSALVAFSRTELPPDFRRSNVWSRARSRTDASGSRTRSSSRASPTRRHAEAAVARIGRDRERSRGGARAAGVPRARRGIAVRRAAARRPRSTSRSSSGRNGTTASTSS